MQGTYYIFLSNIHDESENDWVYVIYGFWINFSLKCTMLFESLLLLRRLLLVRQSPSSLFTPHAFFPHHLSPKINLKETNNSSQKQLIIDVVFSFVKTRKVARLFYRNFTKIC